jgi:acyl-CoA synthetase (AMP-forming)/AMP-acid ligase II
MSGKENIISLFIENAEKYPDKIALVYEGESLSYSELLKQVRETATGFALKGIRRGDKVMVLLPMSLALYRVTLALFYLGATAVFLDEWAGMKRLNECCKTVPCDALVGLWKLRFILWFISGLRGIRLKLNPDIKSAKTPLETAHVTPDDCALITFTTGSTGKPKAAVRTHQVLTEQFNALRDIIKPGPDEADMPSLPIILLINLAAGCTSVIPEFNARKPQTLNPGIVWRQMEETHVTRITASPYFIKRIAEFILENHIPGSQIRKIGTGGAAVFPDDAALFRKAFPQAEIIIAYGSTEAEPISSITANELISAAGSSYFLPAGKPHKKTEARIIRISDGPITAPDKDAIEKLFLPPDEVGEIVVAGPHVLKEYYNSEEAFLRNKIVIDGKVWHRTGDAGCLDNNGNLFLAGRCQLIIDYNGRNIYPFLFENFCKSIEGVETGTIINKNKKLIACIQAKPDADKKTIEEKLKVFNMPFTVIFLDKIPMDKRHFSKIDYHTLVEQLPS